MKKILFCLILLTMSAPALFAQGEKTLDMTATGNDFLTACGDRADASMKLMCLGYVTGVYEGWLFAELKPNGTGASFCVPNGVTREQTFDLTIKFVKDHPAQRQLITVALIGWAIRDTFPCPAAAK